MSSNGLVAVTADEAGRFTQFAICMQGLNVPAGARTVWQLGNDIAGGRNNACRRLMEDEDAGWVWFIDDDHAFAPDILLRLLAHDVDIVTPLCLRRQQPFPPAACLNSEEFLDLENRDEAGLVEVEYAGSAGMLIRRELLDTLEEPWFAQEPGVSEDYVFCRKARAAGFRVWVDLGTQLGHITTAVIWPTYDEDSDGWVTGFTVADGYRILVASEREKVLA